MAGVANTTVESVNDGKQAAWFIHQYLQVAWVPGLPRSVRVLIMRRRKTFENRGRPGLKYHVR